MKKFLLSLATAIFFFTNVNAQLVANAGNNQSVCIGIGGNVTLGGSPTSIGGTPPFHYTWTSSPPTTIIASVANPIVTMPTVTTSYYLIVTDTLGAIALDTVTITVQQCTGFNISQTNTTCNNVCNGSATVDPAANYRYLWSNTDTSRTATGLCAGTYSVTVMDSVLTPLDTLNVTITQPNPIIIQTAFTTNVTCFGGSNGSAQVTVNGGGVPPAYFYIWSNGATTPLQQNLSAGVYTVTVFDNSQCSASAGVVINQPAPLTVTTAATPESAPGACDGTITTTVSGGTPPYMYAWSPTFVTVPIITGLCQGAYTLTVTDVNGCTGTATNVVTGTCANNTIVLSIASTGNLDCTHSADTLSANVSGGTPPFTYYWNNSVVDTEIIVNQSGVYLLWVTDSAGCVKTAIDTVLNLGVTISLRSATPLACNGLNNGNIFVTVAGGLPPYTYLWSNGGTADSIAGIASGTYTLTVTDAALCSATFSYYLGQNSTNWSYYVYVNSTNSNCVSNGTATANVSGGTGPFTYLWSTNPAQTTPTVTGLAGGYCYVTVTGSDGCTRTGSTYIYTNCYNIVQGYSFNDTNGNCVKDSGETAISNVSVTASNGSNTYYGYSYNGFFTINVPTAGNFNITASVNSYGSCSNVNVCGAQTASFTALGDTANVNFGFGASSGFNLNIHPGWQPANPGQTKNYWVLYNQTSLPTYTGPATIVFKYDSILVFQSCNNGGVLDANAHTITWTVSSVPYPSWDWNTVPRAYFTLPASTPLNYQLSQEFWLTPTSGDCDVSNNHVQVTELTTGSRDPNEKDVSPSGDIMEEDSVLTYTIHFQNTGNDTTWFITVKDTLSQYVNPATVENIASSHDYTSFTISDYGILTWVFNPIFLVDSATNEPASKGFVMFKVKKKNNLPLTTQIKNKADIYFDYNEPVATNTVSNTVTEPNFIFTLSGDENISVTAMPNPFTQSTLIVVEGIAGNFDFELFDVTGKLMKKISNMNENRFELKRDDMSAGVYFYRITTTSKQRAYGRVVVE